jgi:hypothetical protein
MFPVKLDTIYNRIQCLADYFGLQHAKPVGQSDKQDAQQKPPSIYPEKFF